MRGRERGRVGVALTVVGAACLAVVACVGAPEGEGAAKTVSVRVENDVGSASSLHVYLVPEGGNPLFLGTVRPSAREAFRVDGVMPLREHRIVARTREGREVTSRDFIFRERRVVVWSVYANLLSFPRGGGSP